MSIVLRKWLPNAIVLISYMVIWLLLLSAMGMWLGLALDHGDLSHKEMSNYLRWFSVIMPFYAAPLSKPFLLLTFCGVLCWVSWLFSTRVRLSNSSVKRRTFFFLFAWGTFTIMFTVFSAGYVKPISYDLILSVDGWVTKPEYRPYLHPGGLKMLGILMMALPTIALYQFWVRLWSEYRSDILLQEWFETYQFVWKRIGRFGDERAMVLPDIVLALDAVTRTDVVLTGDSRQLGTLLIGPPGSGKTSLKIIKAFQQDLAHIQRAFNAFPRYVQKYEFESKEFQIEWANHLIGSIIIEPAKDLCDKSYQIAIEHGIPEEFIVYLDPSDPDTPGFNSMIGPLEQVAETITAVLDGMSENSDDFFRQSCRTVLKQYIYLLKFLKKNECTLMDLDHMYQDPRYVADLVDELEKKIPKNELIQKMSKDKKIFWMLAIRTIQWFRNDGIAEERDKQSGMFLKYTDGPHKGKLKIMDKQFEFTRQTRNLISDLITNPYLARILIGQNKVDLDKIMSRGGILLCNTANGELGNVSDAFGKLVLMSVQNAVFRRKGDEKTRPLVSLYVDEFYDYLNAPFLKLTAQGRKYKIAPLVACQTLSQFDIKFGNGFTDGMMGTIRNYVVYGGVNSYDAEKFSPHFGSQIMDELTTRESITPENMASPNYSISESTTREEVERVTQDQIMFNKFKYSYIRLVVEGSTTKAVRAEGDFINFGQSDSWKKLLKQESLNTFMVYWREERKMDVQFDMDWIDESSELLNMNSIDSGINHNKGSLSEEKNHQANEEVNNQRAAYIGNPNKFKDVNKVSVPDSRFKGIGVAIKNSQLPAKPKQEILTDPLPKPVLTDQDAKPAPSVEVIPIIQNPVVLMPEVRSVAASSLLTFDIDKPIEATMEQPEHIEKTINIDELKKELINQVQIESMNLVSPEQQKKDDQVNAARKNKKVSKLDELIPAQEVDLDNPMFKLMFQNKKK
jgi:hypothetical protein